MSVDHGAFGTLCYPSTIPYGPIALLSLSHNPYNSPVIPRYTYTLTYPTPRIPTSLPTIQSKEICKRKKGNRVSLETIVNRKKIVYISWNYIYTIGCNRELKDIKEKNKKGKKEKGGKEKNAKLQNLKKKINK